MAITPANISEIDGHIDEMHGHTKSVVLGFGPLCNLSDHISNMMPHIDFGSGGSTEGVFAKLSEKMSSCLNTIKGWWASAKNWFLGMFSQSASDPTDTSIMDKISSAWAAVKNFFSPVMDAFAWVAGKVKDIISSVGSAIVGAFDSIKLASCSEFKNANVDPTFIDTDSPLATAKSSGGKTENQIIQEHMMNSPANSQLADLSSSHESVGNSLSATPPDLDSIV